MAPRRRSERAVMDVKVIYAHDGTPQHTMVAHAGRREVRVATRDGARLGRTTLKPCLSAICAASPELVCDEGRDYVLYAVDPAESAHLARSPARHVFVGKGFFRACLEEPGDGAGFVTGRVCADPQSADAFASDDEDACDVLEITLRLKDAPRGGRAQYDSVMRGIRASAPPAFAPEQTAQLLHVLHALQSHTHALPEQQRSQLVGLLSMVGRVLEGGAQGGEAPAPAPAPDPPARVAPPALLPPPAPALDAPLDPSPSTRPKRICYNCGATASRPWRIMQLSAGTHVSHPLSERPPTDAVPLTWVPRYSGLASAVADGETRWEACNPCGLYYTKYGVSRPGHMQHCGPARPKRAAAARKRKADTGASSPESMLPPPVPAAASSPPSAYRVPPYLMNSSPGTVMTTLMSEADLDFEEMQMRGVRTPQSPSPLRRSPRKRPHGTHSGVNPYATAAARGAVARRAYALAGEAARGVERRRRAAVGRRAAESECCACSAAGECAHAAARAV